MHEMALAEGVLQLIEEAAQTQGFRRVRTVWLEIGELAGVEPAALRFCFESVVADSLAAGARLEIIHRPGQGRCRQCGCVSALHALYDGCGRCGGHHLEVTDGDQLRVAELEVE